MDKKKYKKGLNKNKNYKLNNKKIINKKYWCDFCKLFLKSSTENTLKLHFNSSIHKKSVKKYFSKFEIEFDENLLEYVSGEEVELIDILKL